MIVIVDYGMGNSGSVLNMIRKVGGVVQISNDLNIIADSDKLVLPGVGSFDAGMRALQSTGIEEALRHAIEARKVPLLGICLGMQLLLESSEEGSMPGMALVPGRVRRFQVESMGLRVPHMGWNTVKCVKPSSLLEQTNEEQRFYFVHSYFVECTYTDDIAGITHHGHEFVSIFERGNLMGVQFHPEKSHRFGMALFRRFLSLDAQC